MAIWGVASRQSTEEGPMEEAEGRWEVEVVVVEKVGSEGVSSARVDSSSAVWKRVSRVFPRFVRAVHSPSRCSSRSILAESALSRSLRDLMT